MAVVVILLLWLSLPSSNPSSRGMFICSEVVPLHQASSCVEMSSFACKDCTIKWMASKLETTKVILSSLECPGGHYMSQSGICRMLTDGMKARVMEAEEDVDWMVGGKRGPVGDLSWMHKDFKPCPNCSTPIEKNDGCDHMYCNVCGHHFAWGSGNDLNFLYKGWSPLATILDIVAGCLLCYLLHYTTTATMRMLGI